LVRFLLMARRAQGLEILHFIVAAAALWHDMVDMRMPRSGDYCPASGVLALPVVSDENSQPDRSPGSRTIAALVRAWAR
jgi:hypothetical protein